MVYIVSFIFLGGEEHIFGIYSTKKKAAMAMELVRVQNGKKAEEGLICTEYTLDPQSIDPRIY